MKKAIQFIFLLVVLTEAFLNKAQAQLKAADEQIASSQMLKDSLASVQGPAAKEATEQALLLKGFDALWRRTGNGKYFQYIQNKVDHAMQSTATEIDYGPSLLLLYKVTAQLKYFKAATALWEQETMPQALQEEKWLSVAPFLTEYAALVQNNKAYDQIAAQLILREKALDAVKSGLKIKALANYILALTGVLEYFPLQHPKRKTLLAIINRQAITIQQYQDPKSAIWYHTPKLSDQKNNYLEAAVSNQFVYTLQKGMRQSWLPASYAASVNKAYQAILKKFLKQPANSQLNIQDLGTSSPESVNIGSFLLAANEMELAKIPQGGKGKTVLLDYYFNAEKKLDQSGHEIQWHYKWEEMSNGGYSLWGEQFQQQGFQLASLRSAPTADKLKSAAIYIIADPDIPKENPLPNYIAPADLRAISNWVKTGGILVIMANDTGNTELDKLNLLAANFGMQFNKDSKGRVIGKQFEMGQILIPSGNPIFKHSKRIYVKEYSTLQVQGPAKAVLKDQEGNTVIATAKLGKGTVFAIGDPWLYNEYVDGRKLPASYDNFLAGAELVSWLSNL